jgi:hypothetical protein
MKRPKRLAWMGALLFGALGACASLQKKPYDPKTCGDPCATMSCPDGMRCQVGANCGPTCEVQRSWP